MQTESTKPEVEATDNASHPARLEWMRSYIAPGDRVLEIGCGTGWGVALSLRLSGIDIIGTDLDQESITRGREIFNRYGLDGDQILFDQDAATVEGRFDAVILSEVVEHLPDDVLVSMLATVRSKLNPDGVLLITTPNGYGWFEFEQAIWTKLRIGRLVKRLRMGHRLMPVRSRVSGGASFSSEPNTLSASPHVQRFTLKRLFSLLSSEGFDQIEARGSGLFAGPFTASLFTGVKPFIRLNKWLGRRFPSVSSGFYLAARPTRDS